MLHPKAVELMVYARKVGAKVGLITNGSKFTEDSIRRLLDAQVDMIEFSVDAADPETYVVVRKGLNWEVLLKNVSMTVDIRNKLKSATKIIRRSYFLRSNFSEVKKWTKKLQSKWPRW